MNVRGGMEGGALEGFAQTDVERDLFMFADGGEKRGCIVGCVPESVSR